MTNSRDKGKRGERALAAELCRLGLPARRGQQFNGLEGEDVICEALPHWHLECKFVERLDLRGAVEQAKTDAGARWWAVCHKRNRGEWLVTLPLQTMARLWHLDGPPS